MTDAIELLREALANLYAIERKIGVGGMATVFAARDLRHDRVVALKVLKPELAATLGAERFLREIRVAAKLNHPHVLPLLDSGTAEGQPTALPPYRPTAFLYYTMPIVEGESLRARLSREGQLGVEETCRLAKDIGAALDYAHRQGVIHRDIKPENILFHHGEPMVADFGIALAVKEAGGERLTETGISVGTPHYMSPEQVSGDRQLDARSDVYALGCVLYEALVGEPPFTGPSAMAVMARHVTDPVRPIATVRPDVPGHLVAAISRALAKVPADRFDSAGHLAVALSTPGPAPAQQGGVSGAKQTAAVRRTVAVLPFANLSADPENEYFSDGITDDVMSQLSKVGELKVISRTSTTRFRDTKLSLREIGEQLNADVILEGTVRKAGSCVRIVAQLIDARDDTHVWNDTFDRMLTDVFEIQSEVAISIAEALEAHLSPKERQEIQKKPTDDLEAYDLYLLGRHHCNKRTADDLAKAIEYFNQALERDPGYADACAGLAEVYVFAGIGYMSMPSSEAYALAKELARRAIELNPDRPAAHSILGFATLACDWDPDKAEMSLARALEIDNNHVQAYQWLAWCRIVMGDYLGGSEAWERALELDPLSPVITVESGWPFGYAGLHELALERYQRALEMEPDFALAHFDVGWAQQSLGRYQEAIQAYEKSVELSGGAAFMKAFLASAYCNAGRRESAEALLRELSEQAEEQGGMGMTVAIVAEALGHADLALDWLERAYASRDEMISALPVRGFLPYASLHGHPRFQAILDGIGIPPHDIEGEREKLLERVGSVARRVRRAAGRDLREAGSPAGRVAPEPAAEAVKKSIAVLPFANMSAHLENEYFSDGITEDIITQLSKIGAFKVISRSSSMRYKQTEKSMREIARELGVETLIEGSVRRAGGSLRITAQLVDAESDMHLWAESYDRELTDVFAIQTDVALSVASALQTALTPGEQARIEARPTDDMRAYDLCLLGRHHAARLTTEGLSQAVGYFEQALEQDPSYAAAYAGLADVHALSAIGYRPVEPRDSLEKAKAAAFKATELDETLAEAHAPLGHIYACFEFRWDDARRELERAVELNPSSVQAHQYYGQYFLPMRDYQSAYVELKRALELDPLSVVLTTELCWPAMYAGDQERAREQVLKALEMDPSFPLAHFNLAQTYHFQGRYLEAIPIYEEAVELSGGVWFIMSYLAWAYAASDQREKAEAIGVELQQESNHGMGLELGIAMVHDALGRSDEAMDWLEKAFDVRSPMLAAVGLDVLPFNSVRDDPRFHALLEKMGLERLVA